MTAQEVRTHIRYSGWASGKLLDAVRAVAPKDLARPNGISHGSLLGTLAHIYEGDTIWYIRTVDSSEPLIEGADLPTLDQRWPALQSKWEAWAGRLADRDLDRMIDYRLMNGTPGSTPVWQIVLHVVNHATLHRGQAMGMLRQMGIPPPHTDLIYYYRETAATAP